MPNYYSRNYIGYQSIKIGSANFSPQYEKFYMVKDHNTYMINSKLRPSPGQPDRQTVSQ